MNPFYRFVYVLSLIFFVPSFFFTFIAWIGFIIQEGLSGFFYYSILPIFFGSLSYYVYRKLYPSGEKTKKSISESSNLYEFDYINSKGRSSKRKIRLLGTSRKDGQVFLKGKSTQNNETIEFSTNRVSNLIDIENNFEIKNPVEFFSSKFIEDNNSNYKKVKNTPVRIEPSSLYQFEYIDSVGQITSRRVKFRGVEFNHGNHLLNALDLDKNASRTFRVDRISKLVDLDTGEMIADAELYFESVDF